ncbi:MAG: hypothetical protein ACI399_00950 [Candidatus Cryptobacteroides sp.]
MKNFILPALLSAAFLFSSGICSASDACRTYGMGELQNIYSMGNGKLCVYGREGNIYQIFGSPYSGPSMLGLMYEGGTADLEVSSARTPKTAIWSHSLFLGDGTPAAALCDFVSYSGNALVRRIVAERELEFGCGACFEERYRIHAESLSFEPVSLEGFESAWKVTIAPGVPFYSRYNSPGGYSYIIATGGNARITSYDENTMMLKIVAGQGESFIYVIASDKDGEGSVPNLEENARIIAGTSWRKLRRECRKEWKKYSKPQDRLDYKALDRAGRKELKEAVDNVGTLLKCQQGEEGGVLAGIVYHMVYVRDHYGVSRAMLALGHSGEAKKVLQYYFEIFSEYGYIRNAQASGWKGIFHPHENDETEITGYLIVQAFDYYEKTGDAEFIEEIMPMLEWAAAAQQKNIVKGMLPFNGDETYIAGGVVPRSVMYHGSAEATLLFIEGGKKLLDFVRRHGLWSEEKAGLLQKDIDECASLYRENFYSEGRFCLNNPEREKEIEFPETRPGVCLYPGYLEHYLETFHYKGPLYFCKDCMERDMSGIVIPEPERYSIPSAFLFPFYIDASLFTEEEKENLLQEVIDLYLETGKISSQDRILGYDYGMFLYALVKAGNPLAGEVYRKMMDMRDKTGAWVEYYVEGVPNGCPCRPWESGINIEAALEYAAGSFSANP